MHVEIIKVIIIRPLVLLSCEPSQPHLVKIDPERVDPVQKHVYSEVEFQLIYEVRLVNVPLHHHPLLLASVHDFVQTSRKENALPLGKTLWLDDVGFSLLRFLDLLSVDSF